MVSTNRPPKGPETLDPTDIATRYLKREIALMESRPTITMGTAVWVRNLTTPRAWPHEQADLQQGRPRHFTPETWDRLVRQAAAYRATHPDAEEGVYGAEDGTLVLGTFRISREVGGVTHFDRIWGTVWTEQIGDVR